jgi:hypothetical protein
LNTNHKARILRKKPLEKTILDFKKWVKSIQIGAPKCWKKLEGSGL